MSVALAKRPLPSSAPTPSPTIVALRTAVEQQLRAMVDQGASSTVLGQIERFCRSSREALMSIEHPKDMVQSRLGISNYSLGNVGSYSIGMPDGSEMPMPTLAPAPGNETYGANFIRELIATATKIAGKKAEPSLYDLAIARNMAKATKNKRLLSLIDAQIEKMCAELEPTKETKKKKPRASLRA